MRRFISGIIARAALLLLLAAVLIGGAQAQIGPAPGGGGSTPPGGSSGQIQYNNSGSFGGLNKSGTGFAIVSTSGTLTSGNCVKIDASGNMIDAGGVCGGSSGVSSLTTACPAGLSLATGAVTATGAIPTNAQTGTSYTIQASDCGKLLTFNNASPVSVTLPQAGVSGFLSGFFLAGVQNLGAGAVTITPAASTLNGAASLTLASGQSITGLVGDGANYFAIVTAVPGGSAGQVQYNNAGSFGGYSKSGNGSTIASTSGSLVAGNCIKSDASGNLVDSGGACGGGGGTPGGFPGQVQYNNAGAFGGLAVIGSGSVVEASGLTGSGTKVATATAAGTSGNCAKWDASGNVADAGAGCAGSTPWTYQPGLWYSPFSGTFSTGLAFAATGNTYCTPFAVAFTFTFDQWSANIATAGSSNAHFAIYGNGYNSTNKRNFPSGAPIASDNNNPANNATGAITFTFASNVQLSPGLYWACAQQNDTTGKFTALANNSPVSGFVQMIGAAAPGNANGGQNWVGLTNTGGLYGTWPNAAAATSWTQGSVGFAPSAALHVFSVP